MGAAPTAAAPALRRGLAVLRVLAERPGPVSAAAVARDLGLARSTVYELLGELAAAGFATHVASERRWGLGVAAFEIGTAYLRADPLERLGRPVLTRLARTAGGTAHLGVLHGGETLYLAKERPAGPAPALVTDVGVRLPAPLTATGVSILAALPAAQIRALFPDRGAFVDRTGRGPASPGQLREVLAAARLRGWSLEDGQVSADTASVAAAVFDHNGRPVAAVGVTVRHRCDAGAEAPGCPHGLGALAGPVRAAAADLTGAVGGLVPGGAASPPAGR
ncbi:IclR family transcriptional regulator [Nakamurella endophytica]|uniref:IclR family transcriptional regulator n=1 Tax=Nakamurella endophytica TaxID=1748367 RepID=A0A917SJQ3_9ACTN|nr:IclR family transcriptional regulator [Nakamurella endophytica]GGL85771.1 IclR family transcriptional regulator [Nakamurella endophytica]